MDASYFEKGPHLDQEPPVAEIVSLSTPVEVLIGRPAPVPSPRPSAPSLRKVVAVPPLREPTIQLDPELQAEVEARLPNESTLITRNPLERRPEDEDTEPGKRRRT